MIDFRGMPFVPAAQTKYVYRPEVTLAVNVALVTDRVLLVRGEPGTGKSTLAEDVAARLHYSLHAETVTSRTEARDLLWSFDNVQRLNDAYARTTDSTIRVDVLEQYVKRGVLWDAFESAGEGAVVLLDEIDKADPDVPNDLLVPLDRRSFRVDPLKRDVPLRQGKRLLVIVTTNGERDLPQAFLRRCITVDLPRPKTLEELEPLARVHFGQDPWFSEVFPEVAAAYVRYSDAALARGLRSPATAELVDAVRAAIELRKVRPDLALGPFLEAALWKHVEPATRPSAVT